MEYVIESHFLCKRYRKHEVLRDLNIHIPKGSVYGLIGRNGAGKTTFMRIICGIQIPTSGDFTVFGVSGRDREIARVRKRMGAVVETPALCYEMSARDNLKQQNCYLGIPDDTGIDELLELVGLSGTGRKKAGDFSLGMKQRLGLAMALAGDPDIIILDEPVNGLDPEGIIEIRETILKLNREKCITFVISSHILDELSRIATHYGFIEDGHIVEEISAEDIAQKCRKAFTIGTDSADVLSSILEQRGQTYEIGTGGEVIIYGDIDVSSITRELLGKGGDIKSISQTNESLESYYLNLIGNKADGGSGND